MKKLTVRQQKLLCFLGLFCVLVLLGNTNNIPDSFAERIFKPIQNGGSTFHYSGLIIFFVTYVCLTRLNTLQESVLLKTGLRRFVMMIVIINVFSGVMNANTQVFKSFYNDLNAIYLNREKTTLSYNGTHEEIRLSGTLEFKNCSQSTQTFKLKVKSPYLIKELTNQDFLTFDETWILQPREKVTLQINEVFKATSDQDTSFSGFDVFEYVIFNNSDESVFHGTVTDYQSDKWFSSHHD